MVTAEKRKAAEVTGCDSLLRARNLLRIAIYNISYIRGLFLEKYFNDKSVPALEMKIKKLMPMDAESRRLIDWMEKGVYDALQKKYLKTLLFCICEKEEGPMIEEYALSFSYPNTNGEEVAMNMSHKGSKKNSATFKSNAAEVTPDQMRISACKMMRTLVSLMRTLDQMPEERTILMKLLYYDETTPEDYEPPFFKGCAENETVNIWNKNPLEMEVGNVNSKHLVLALKVKSVLDPCDANDANSDDDKMSLGHESDQDDDFTVRPSEVDHYVVAPNDGTGKGQSGTNSEDETQDAAHEEELTAQVRAWICSRDMGTVNASDVLSNYPDISLEMVEDILERLLKDGLLSRAGKDGYAVKKVTDPKTPYIKKEVAMHNVSPTEETKNMYMKAMNLLRIAIYNISYIRGLFPEKYFNDKSVPALEIKIKKLMPMDAESRRLIDWMEKGVYDALQKKYLKTLLLCICEKEEGPMIEEYAFSFSFPSSNGEEVAMNMSRTGSKKNSATFKSNAAKVTPDQKRSSTLTIAKLQGKRDGEANQSTVRKLIDKMVQDGYIKNSGNRRLGKSAVHLEVTNKIFLQAATGSVPSKSSNAAVSGKECSNIRAPSNCPTRKENIDASSSGNGEDPNRGNARNVSSNDAIPLIRVTVRRLSDLTALDPVLVILVLSAEDSVEKRITLVIEGRHRGFLFAKNQAFRQACLRMFMEGYIAIEAAAEEIGDPDYEAAEDLPAGEDGHEEEEDGQRGEAAGQQEGQDEVELQQEEGEEEDQEEEDGEEDEEHEDEEALPSDDSKADDDWSLIEDVKIDDAQDGDQEEVPQQEEGEDEDEEDDWSLMDDDEINDPDYSPSSGVESDDSGSIDFCDDSWLWFTSESDSEANDDDSDYLPSSASD